jgi:hypothetical protein
MAHTMWQTELVDRSLACKACTQVRPCQAGNALARMRCIRSNPVPAEPSPLDRPCTPSRSPGAGKSHPDTPRTRWTYQPMQRSQACILGTRLPPPDFVQSPLDTQGTLSRLWMAVTFRPDTASTRSPRWHTETSQQCMPHSLPSHSRWCRFPRGMACIESRPRKNRSYSCNTPRPVMDTVPVDMIGMRPGQKKQTWTCSTASKHTPSCYKARLFNTRQKRPNVFIARPPAPRCDDSRRDVRTLQQLRSSLRTHMVLLVCRKKHTTSSTRKR